MTTLAGRKIRRHRESARPKIGRPAFAAQLGTTPSTLQGWEEEGKRSTDADIVNRLAEMGVADHADWYRPGECPRCELVSDDPRVAACTHGHCPLASRRAA